MGPSYDSGPVGDRTIAYGDPYDLAEGEYPDVAVPSPRQNGGYSRQPGPPGSPALTAGTVDSRRSGERDRSRHRNGRSGSGQIRLCKKCGEHLAGQFVRALDGTFHLDCFTCRDCGDIVASKFFPADDEGSGQQYPLCETDYFRRLGLLCHSCGSALRGSYITALDRKYHVDHFTCSVCPTIFGAQDSYYEHDGQVYCHFHYSTRFAQRCNGCRTSILKQFVEIMRNGQNQHWHPECYMIHKFWNVRLTPAHETPTDLDAKDDPAGRETIRQEEEKMEEKVYRIWSVLSAFEESSAACISDMLLHVSNGSYVDGVMVAKKFIWHVDVLFQSADTLDATMKALQMEKGLSYGREAKLLCKKIVAFFSLLSKSQDTGARKLGVTQDLLTLVTGLAHYLKLLIRICLQGALRIEKERNTSEPLDRFLNDLTDPDSTRIDEPGLQITSGTLKLSANDSDQCTACQRPVEDECIRSGEQRWHLVCFKCSNCSRELGRDLREAHLWPGRKGKLICSNCVQSGVLGKGIQPEAGAFERISKLQQYIFLLKVALARLLEILRSTGAVPYSSEDPTMNDSGSADVLRTSGDAPHLRPDARSKSYGGSERDRESTYESAVNDVRRLRSTRLDKHLSSSFRKARTSRIMDGPEERSARSGSAEGNDQAARLGGLHIVEDQANEDEGQHDLMYGHQDALTLDDLPRIVAAEQAREQRNQGPGPRNELFRSPATELDYGANQQRARSNGREGEQRMGGDRSPQRGGGGPVGGVRYLSELSALESFILRHCAVLAMHPLVESEFTLEELLNLIESRKAANFWKNIGKAFSNKDKPKNAKKKGIFGVPLEVIIEKDGADSTDGVGPGTLRIPAVVDDILTTMRGMDLSVEGIFRKNGNIKKLGDLCEKIDRDGCDANLLSAQPVVQLAALLKRYLRDLPDPLMTHKLYRLWLVAAKLTDENQRRQCLHYIICLLPKPHRDSLEVLFVFLKWVGSFHHVDEESGSKMDSKNLATVIAPNILYSSSKAPALDSDPMFAISAVEQVLNDIEQMCQVPLELGDILNDPTLVSNSGEITTKEIIKKYGTLRYGDAANEVGRPIPRRVETEPSTWPAEATAKPILEPTLREPAMPFASPNMQVTPPPSWRQQEDGHSSSPYGQHTEPAANGGDARPPRREWRNSNWGRPNGSVAAGLT